MKPFFCNLGDIIMRGQAISDLLEIGRLFNWIVCGDRAIYRPVDETEIEIFENYTNEGVLIRLDDEYRPSEAGMYILQAVYIIDTKSNLLKDKVIS